MQVNAQQIQKITRGKFIVNPNCTADFAIRANLDSRTCKCGDMFVAVKGDKVDGNSYIANAIKAGASIVICDGNVDKKAIDEATNNQCAIIQVNNSLEALKQIAIYNRQSCRAKVIGLTGSCGKTSTKQLIKDVLAYNYKVCATRGNYNNEIGVPITLCDCNPDDDFLVVEMGMRGRNQISALCEYVEPDVGIITNVGQSHIELLGSTENIAKAKSEIIDSLVDGIGQAVLNCQDDYLDYVIKRSFLNERNIKITLFGGMRYNNRLAGNQIFAQNIELNAEGFAKFDLTFSDGQNEIVKSCRLNVPGLHNVVNACCAAAVGLMIGMTLDDCSQALELSRSEEGRLNILVSNAGFRIIDDAYNANPQSMMASLDTFARISSDGKRIAILGDMFELGKYAEQAHKQIGEYVAKLGIDELICIGELAKTIATNARLNNKEINVLQFEDNKDAIFYVLNSAKSDDLILVKASNGMCFNDIVRGLVDNVK